MCSDDLPVIRENLEKENNSNLEADPKADGRHNLSISFPPFRRTGPGSAIGSESHDPYQRNQRKPLCPPEAT